MSGHVQGLKRPKRANGDGYLYVKDGSWWGRWMIQGQKHYRRLGRVTEVSQGDASELLRKLAVGRSTYSRRAGIARHTTDAGVYFIVGGDKVKIGRTERTPIQVRLERIQRWSPVELTLHRFVSLPFPDAVEKALHDRFARLRSHGEWFDDVVLAVVDSMSDEDMLALARRDRPAA